MNSIELFEKAGIYREKLTQFELDDFVKVQKQFEFEKSHNPTISSELGNDLTLAM
jgi:hypothetical protein